MVLPVAVEKPLTCLVVADHQLCGQALGGLLSEQCGLELQAVCESVAEAVGVMEHSDAPELLLLDLGQAGEHWQDVAAALQRLNPDARLIMLSGRQNPWRSLEPMTAIVLGVVDKGGPWDDLIALVSRWQQQNPAPSVRRRLLALEQLDRLSPRERNVFHYLGKGMQSKEIARQLGLCVNTVDTYRKTISGKLGLSGAELVRAAALQRCTNRLGD